MAEIQLNRETKKQILDAVAAGKGSDLLSLGFPQTDAQFTAEIFQAAEKAENWLFIEHLRDVRAQQRGTIQAATPGKKQNPTMTKEKKPKPSKYQRSDPAPIAIQYDKTRHGWTIVGGPGPQRPLQSKQAAEDYCIKHFRQFPVTIGPATTSQELPQKSVWTGAPWDRTFEHLR
jgi:hypothetical protein